MSDSEDDQVINTYKQIVKSSLNNITKTNSNKSEDNINTDEDKIKKLKEEINRLNNLVRQYRKESKNIILKCVHMRDREKTSIMQTLELFKLNSYLIKNIPNSKQVLQEYLTGDSANDVQNEDNTENDDSFHRNDSDFDTETESEKDAKLERYPRRKRKTNRNVGKNKSLSSEQSDDSNDSTYSNRKKKDSILGSYGRGKRFSRSATKRNRSENQSEDESMIGASPAKATRKRSLGARTRSSNSTVSRNLAEDKPKDNQNKSKTKNSNGSLKKTRSPEPAIGRFPCTFNKNQCQQVLQSKDDYNFHMNGHLEAKFVCPFCAYTAPTINAIKRHITAEREDEPESGDSSSDTTKTRMHRNKKIYLCNACKVCHKVHERDEKRCNHIMEDKTNRCKWTHDIDYEFKDHLRGHIEQTFGKSITDKDLRKKKIREIVDKFVDSQYFENNAKKKIIIEKYGNKNDSSSSDSDDWD